MHKRSHVNVSLDSDRVWTPSITVRFVMEKNMNTVWTRVVEDLMKYQPVEKTDGDK